MEKLPRWFKVSLYLTADFLAIFSIGLFVLFSRDLTLDFQEVFLWSLVIYTFALIFLLFVFGVYSMITLHFGLIDSVKIGVITIAFNLLMYLFIISIRIDYSPIELAFAFVSEPAILIGLRVARRVLAIVLGYQSSNRKNLKRTLVIGAGAAGKIVIDELRTNRSLEA
ncbi:MAG: hypothetical protein RIS53_313, partial [Bacillota bacterium]